MYTEHKNLTWTLMLLLLSGVLCDPWGVDYQQENICALKGSSVVIPCSFYYPKDLKVQSVKWAHERDNIYVGPFIFDSESNNTSSRYQYIGDKHHNCSFKIHHIQHNDTGKHAFRFKTISRKGPQAYTGITGSRLKIVDLKVLMTQTNGNGAIKEDDSVNLTCLNGCDSGGFSSTFTWFKNGEPMKEGPILHLSNISSSDSGNYSCSLKAHKKLTSGVIIIDVEFGPKNTSVSVSPSAEVDVGLNITLICRTHANPTAQNYTWYKKGDSDDFAGNGPELSFIGISPCDGGEYLCSVINKHGRQNSSAVTVRVKEHCLTFPRDVLIIATVAATLLTVTAVIAIRGVSKKSTRAPKTPPETDCVEDIENAVYINWPVCEKRQSEAENRCEGTTEVIYATVDFNTKRTSNKRQRVECHDDEEIIYSTICRGQIMKL